MPFARWRTYRERAQQKRKAIHMLALSGVVRPSHVELRYTVPLLKVGAWHHSPTIGTGADAPQQAPLQHSTPAMSAPGKQLLQWLRQTAQLPKRALPPWTGITEN
jgi:hypothetical protein